LSETDHSSRRLQLERTPVRPGDRQHQYCGHDAKETRGEESRQIAGQKRTAKSRAVGGEGGADLMAGKNPTKNYVGSLCAETFRR
jgi:hypothetical protein